MKPEQTKTFAPAQERSNMVTATFKNGETTATANGLEKGDYGQILRIKGLDLPQYVAVQFAASGMSEAMPPVIGETVEGVTDVLIPNSLLRSNIQPWDYTITAYIYIVSGESGKTEYTITMPVKWRPRTGDDHLDEDPLGVIGKAVEQVNSAATRAETAVSEVETAAAEIAADREQIQTNAEDITGLKSDLSEFVTKRINIFSFENIIADKYIASPSENLSDYKGWSVSDYLPVYGGTSYVLCRPTNVSVTNIYYGLYDSDKNFISSSATNWNDTQYEIKTTENTKYIRVSMATGYFTSPYMIVPLTDFENNLITDFFPCSSQIILNSTTTDNLIKDVEMLKQKMDYDKICRSICRLGYGPYNPDYPPEQSIESYKLAYEKGFRILLCDLQFTSDNIPVLWHDTYLNENGTQVYKDGSLVDSSLKLYIKDMTYADLLTYDFGHYKGTQYDGTQIMTLNQMCELCRNLGCELYIEIKGMNGSNQAKIACDIVSRYGLKNRTSWCAGGKVTLSYIIENIHSARVATMPSVLTDSAFNDLISLKNDSNKVFFFAWDSTILTDELVSKMIENDIQYEMGNLDSGSAILDYFEQGEPYKYCTGVNTGYHIVGKLLYDNYLN